MKHRRLPQPLPSRSQGGTLMGILVGIILGAVVVAGAALFFNRNDNPFTQAAPSPSAPAPAAQPDPAVSALPGRPGGRPSERQDFSFFNNLPKDEAGRPVTPPPTPSTASPPASSKQFYLQLAAFEKAEEADNLKAQLLLMGIDPFTQRAQLPDGRVVHRIRVGPFNDREDLKAMRSRLIAGGFSAEEVTN